jgi:DNA topoisomerase-1
MDFKTTMSEIKQAYCMRCKTKRDILNPTAAFSASGVPMTRGTCAVCGANLSVMGATPAHEQLAKPTPVPRKKSAQQAAKAAAVQKAATSKKSPKRPAAKTTEREANSSEAKKPRRRTSSRKLVIVESPAKARTVGNFLGSEYAVMASKGHVRDLLVSQLSVDVQNDFEPKYRVPNEKRETVSELKRAAADAEVVYLATDPDREGEAIAWHLMAAADIPPARTQRVVFHEITKQAVAEAFAHPRSIDQALVNAQQARRILDRLVGYNITELLWEKVRNRLSAGRVQSIALRMVVDREREIEAFKREEYWTIDAELAKQGSTDAKSRFLARLVRIHDEEPKLASEQETMPHVEALQASQYVVSDYKTGTRQRRPSAPFTTSTLQQEASRRLGFTATRTMKAAQDLYEGIELANGEVIGLITYMRTDSMSVSIEAQQEARQYILQRFGTDFVPSEAPIYKTKAKGAQEAHEAIRPTSVLRHPDEVKQHLTNDQFRLYKLIWERFVASQMSPAVYDTVRVEIAAGPVDSPTRYLLRSSGSRVRFAGFLALYEDSKDEDAAADEDEGRYLPLMELGEALQLISVIPQQHFTEPPPRYTEASLVRALEEYGIGRPSTYAPTVAVIQDRDYVIKQDKRLVPTEIGKIVSDLLVQFFPNEMDYQFTARMEEDLDEIAEGHIEWKPVLRQFYTPFEQRLIHARERMPRVKQDEFVGRKCPTCVTGDLVIKYGRRGKFIGCSNYPECKHTEPYIELTGVMCPQCGQSHGGQVIERKTKRGRTFYGCSRYPDCDFAAWKLPSPAPVVDTNTEDNRIQLPS